jgi:hypothetical protein
MKQYSVVGFDAKDERLFHVGVDAPNQAIAWMMVLAQSLAVIETQASRSPLKLRRFLIYLAEVCSHVASPI